MNPIATAVPGHIDADQGGVLAGGRAETHLNRRGSTELLLFTSVRLFAVLANKT